VQAGLVWGDLTEQVLCFVRRSDEPLSTMLLFFKFLGTFQLRDRVFGCARCAMPTLNDCRYQVSNGVWVAFFSFADHDKNLVSVRAIPLSLPWFATPGWILLGLEGAVYGLGGIPVWVSGILPFLPGMLERFKPVKQTQDVPLRTARIAKRHG
jgi:hypothetical protein